MTDVWADSEENQDIFLRKICDTQSGELPVWVSRFGHSWSECRDSEHYRADAVQPASGKCPPDTCIQMVRISPPEKKKTRTANAVLVFLVRVSRFELEASWTPFKRDTKLRHTRIFCCTSAPRYITTTAAENQVLFFLFSKNFTPPGMPEGFVKKD